VNDPIDELRAVVANSAPPPPELARYLAQVRQCAYEISDADVDGLKTAGVTEDEIFEQTVSTAIGEGLRRLDTALRVIG
jgi:hypothetical protein